MSRPGSILKAALTLHAGGGLETLSMRSLARSIGLSPMALYRHYANKEGLLNAMIEEGFVLLKAELLRPLRKKGAMARLKARWHRTLAFALANPRLFELMFLTPGMEVRRFPYDFDGEASPTFPIFSADVRACMDEGLLREDDPAQVAFLIWTQAHGLLAFSLRGRLSPSPQALQQHFDGHLDRILRGLA